MTDHPTPDEYGRYRVAEKVDGHTRHYTSSVFVPGVHAIVTGPDADASYLDGTPRPPKFNIADLNTDENVTAPMEYEL